MPTEQAAPHGEWSAAVVRYLIYIVGSFTTVGVVFGWLTTFLGLATLGFFVGVALSVLYLLYKIAQEIHHLRINS